jgi:competence protein ComEA
LAGTLASMPELPITRALAIVLAAVAVSVALVLGRVLLPAGGASAPAPVELRVSSGARSAGGAAGAASGARLVVHVVGAVRRPGLYRLRAGSRVADAVEHAGGAAPPADLSLVNLAAPLADGQQVVVPSRVPAAEAGGGGSAGGSEPTGPVHLNTASVDELDELPGIGPVTAQKIVDFREQHGPFSSVEDLDAIPGIGPAKVEQLRDLVAP